MKLKNLKSMHEIKKKLCKYYIKSPNDYIIKVFLDIFYRGYEIGYAEGLDEGIVKSTDRIFEVIDCPFHSLCKNKELLEEISDNIHDCPNGNHNIPCPDFKLINRMF